MGRPAKNTVKKVETPVVETLVEQVVLDHSKQYNLEGTSKTVHMKQGEVFKNVNGSLAEVLVNSGKAILID